MKLTLNKNQNIFFTSDSHFGHTNICRGVSSWTPNSGQRDFNTLHEMNTAIVDGINSIVGENDILIHGGDWSFGGIDNIRLFRTQIICKNIHIWLGNHDHHIKNNKENVRELFSSVNHTSFLEVVKTNALDNIKVKFLISHFPIASWEEMSKGVIHLHGHVHLPPHHIVNGCKAIDIGADGNNFKVHSLSSILNKIEKQPIKCLSLPTDHHEKNNR